MKNISLFLTFCFIVFFFSCKPDDKKKEWDTISVDNLDGCTVNNIRVDIHGNKWFATSKGLAAYNGTKWVLYENTSTPEKSSINWIELININELNSLLLATDAGIAVLSYDKNMNVEINETYLTETTDILSDTVKRTAVGRGDDVWFLTLKGLSYADNVWHKETGNPGLDFTPVKSALMPATGPYYCGRYHNGMIKFNYSDVDGISGASSWIAPYNGVILDTVNYIYKSTSGELWIASFGDVENTGESFPKDGLIRHTGDDPKTGFTYFNDLYGGLTNNRINYIAESDDEKIWLATEGGISYQVSNDVFENYTSADGLIDNEVLCLAFDADGSLWCGTAHGISHFKGGVFINYFE